MGGPSSGRHGACSRCGRGRGRGGPPFRRLPRDLGLRGHAPRRPADGPPHAPAPPGATRRRLRPGHRCWSLPLRGPFQHRAVARPPRATASRGRRVAGRTAPASPHWLIASSPIPRHCRCGFAAHWSLGEESVWSKDEPPNMALKPIALLASGVLSCAFDTRVIGGRRGARNLRASSECKPAANTRAHVHFGRGHLSVLAHGRRLSFGGRRPWKCAVLEPFSKDSSVHRPPARSADTHTANLIDLQVGPGRKRAERFPVACDKQKYCPER